MGGREADEEKKWTETRSQGVCFELKQYAGLSEKKKKSGEGEEAEEEGEKEEEEKREGRRVKGGGENEDRIKREEEVKACVLI